MGEIRDMLFTGEGRDALEGVDDTALRVHVGLRKTEDSNEHRPL